MSKKENEKETKQHQNRGARDLENNAEKQQEAAKFQGEYHEEGKPVVRGNTIPDGSTESLSKTNMAHQGKGGIAQNNLGQHNDHDDDFQSGSKGGNRSGKQGSRQGGSRGMGTK
jgi:hypothetical protein